MDKSKRWSIDAGNTKSLSDVRHAVVGELKSLTDNPDERLAAEILIGEILIEEAATQPQAVALEIVHERNHSTLHIYSQIDTSDETAIADLQHSLASKCGLPLRLYVSPQGIHIEITFKRNTLAKLGLKPLWDVACCILAERAQRILRRRGIDTSTPKEEAARIAP
ncbi:MAG: hypothetical protein M3N19_02150 [Candidatus Eremiobacteraeota bacterium]|nr:hypothetical protein [Candidatus Eremiobacteraeota bacterium]